MACQREHPVTNNVRAVLLEQTGWSMSTAARRITRTAQENGRCLRYSAPSVNHWLTGVRPSPQAVPITVETFARALDRPDLTAEEPRPARRRGRLPGQLVGGRPDRLPVEHRGGDMLDPVRSRSAGLYSTAYLSPEWLAHCRRPLEPGRLTRRGTSVMSRSCEPVRSRRGRRTGRSAADTPALWGVASWSTTPCRCCTAGPAPPGAGFSARRLT